MKVDITINPPSVTGHFAPITLGFVDESGSSRRVELRIGFGSLYDFAHDTDSIAFDFYLIASIVYGVDNLLDRYRYSVDGWAREIKLTVPVKNLTVWNKVKVDMAATLSFLTGDYWDISFSRAPSFPLFEERTNRRASNIPVYDYQAYSFVSLFSGGLDSLVGVVDEVHHLPSGKKGLLVSHFDPTSPGASSDQNRLNNQMGQFPSYQNEYDWIQESVGLSTRDASGARFQKEHSFRSRSLLFLAIGIYCLEKLPNCNTLIIPENGTISLNYPLTPSRVSTLSTRTTHPYFLRKLQTVLTEIGFSANLSNPYQELTKGELVAGCSDLAALGSLYKLSVSCGKRGRKSHWDTRAGTYHCGVCMPCIYRRAALHKVGLDDQLYGIDIFTTQRELHSIQDMPALFDFLSRKLSFENIRRTLLVGSSFSPEELDVHAQLVQRVRKELKQWITDKGNSKIKLQAGIRR